MIKPTKAVVFFIALAQVVCAQASLQEGSKAVSAAVDSFVSGPYKRVEMSVQAHKFLQLGVGVVNSETKNFVHVLAGLPVLRHSNEEKEREVELILDIGAAKGMETMFPVWGWQFEAATKRLEIESRFRFYHPRGQGLSFGTGEPAAEILAKLPKGIKLGVTSSLYDGSPFHEATEERELNAFVGPAIGWGCKNFSVIGSWEHKAHGPSDVPRSITAIFVTYKFGGNSHGSH